MKVTFIQSGGFFGILTGCELDTALLAPEMAQELRQIVKASGISTSGEFFSHSGRDLRQYEITIEDGNSKIAVTFDDETIPASAKLLVSYLKQQSQPKVLVQRCGNQKKVLMRRTPQALRLAPCHLDPSTSSGRRSRK